MIEIDLIKKHGKKALGMAEHGHAKPTWRERVPEILLEIGIIVFAIMLSIQLHSWHEHSLERAAERKFLTGLRQDLTQDLQELRSDSLSYLAQLRGHRYFRALTPQKVNQDSIAAYGWTLRNTTNLLPNNSRFEGLKSSGRLDVIEDDELLNSIMDHYQELIPSLTMHTSLYSAYKREYLNGYLDTHLTADGRNLPAVTASLPMQSYLNSSADIRAILRGYHTVMQHSRELIRQLDHHPK